MRIVLKYRYIERQLWHWHTNFVKSISHISLQDFLGRLSASSKIVITWPPLLINLLIYTLTSVFIFNQAFNQVWRPAIFLCINTSTCLKINQYWTGLFVSYSIENPITQNNIRWEYCPRVQGLYSQQFIFTTTCNSAQWDRVFHYRRLERLDRDKHSTLLGPFIRYKDKLLWLQPLYFKLKLL